MKILQKLTLLLVIISFLTNLTVSQQWYQRGNPHFINEADYQRLVINPQTRNKGVTMLKFFTPWCRYCKYLKDIIDDLKARDTWAITIYEVNCDDTNHHFCGKMGVHSFPKMKVFENGNLMDNMDGFYPYEVVKELFLKYNRTQQIPQPATPVPQTSHQQPPNQEHKQIHVQGNYVKPQAVAPQTQNHENRQHQQHKNQHIPPEQRKHQEKKVQAPLNHSQSNPQNAKPKQNQHHNVEQAKTPQSPKDQHPVATQPLKHEQPKHAQPTHTKQQQPDKQQQIHSPQNNDKIKKTQQMIEEQQNIAVIDQNLKQTQKQKKIVEQMQTKPVDTIDLTKILPGEQHVQYGKYIIYAICIFVGGYYFVHIMKAQPANEQVKPNMNKSKQMSDRNLNTQIPSKVSIEDSELREELHFEHPNQEEVNFNSVQIRDQDL